MKKYSLIVFMLTVCLAGYGQQIIHYWHNGSGNRVSRYIDMSAVSGHRMADKAEAKIDSLTGYKLMIYPNPTQGLLTLQVDNLPETTEASFVVLDMKGTVVAPKMSFKNSYSLEFSNQPSGTFVLTVKIGEKETVWRIIKQ